MIMIIIRCARGDYNVRRKLSAPPEHKCLVVFVWLDTARERRPACASWSVVSAWPPQRASHVRGCGKIVTN